MIFSVTPLDAEEATVLIKIQEMHKAIGDAMGTPSRRWNGLLRRNSFAHAIRGSNSIEGYSVTRDDAVAAVDRESPLEANEETWKAITGYREAMTYVLQLANDAHFHYSTELIRSLHYMMTSYQLDKRPGRWRLGSIFVHDDQHDRRVYEGPPIELVPGLIDELVAALNNPIPSTIVAAAIAHLNLVMIHPFADGNGRMARCLQTLVLVRGGHLHPDFCSIEEYLGRNTRAYYDVLESAGQGAWRPGNDTKRWIRFCLTAHFHQAEMHLQRMNEIAQVWNRVEQMILSRGLSDRLIVGVVDAAIGYRVRNATYRQAADVSEQVASRDLKELVDAGFLVPVGAKRGRYYHASPMLHTAALEVRGTRRPIADPFSSVKASQ